MLAKALTHAVASHVGAIVEAQVDAAQLDSGRLSRLWWSACRFGGAAATARAGTAANGDHVAAPALPPRASRPVRRSEAS